ncbi:MAG TPA: zinc metalloprotease HtpX [Burkholderiales bacterium]|jgi:heat shock protein HtpX
MFNWIKTFVLMTAITVLFGAIGAVLGGQNGMLLALGFALVANLGAYWFSDKMVLSMYNAQEVDEAGAPELYGIVRELAHNAQLPMPRVYLIDEAAPNAFATGRGPEHAAVAATTGILRLLSPRELRGVLAHELAHVRHRDILISTIAATMAGAIATLAQFGGLFGGSRDSEGRSHPLMALLIMIFAPVAAMLIQMAISRSREFGADQGGAEISGDPEALAMALAKIERAARGEVLPAAEEHPATAQMMIINPLSGGGISGLFATHPDTQERIRRLMGMASGMPEYRHA